MVIDIVKFFFVYTLVLFAFACGLNQLLWYFSDLERKRCYILPSGGADWDNRGDSCLKWRSFANVFEASQSLFWASFGLVDLSNFELSGIKTYTRFWGLLMFGSYSVINVIVLLNLLIAMMSNSYAMIDEQSDTEWKFARTKLWLSYFEEGGTLPPPFNIFPTMKTFMKMTGMRKKDRLRRKLAKMAKEGREKDLRYTSVMRALVWRYVSSQHRKMEENPVTEDDINEVKADISSFRYDILEVFGRNGMDTTSVDKREKSNIGKKMKVWERRLMKDFKVAPVMIDDDKDLVYEPPPENEAALSRFRRVAKLVAQNSSLDRWRQVVKGACLASQIGHCSSRDSFKKQQNLLKAMEEARRIIVTATPGTRSRAPTPIDLPDVTGQSIMGILKGITGDDKTSTEDQQNISSDQPLQPHVIISDDTRKPSITLQPATPTRQTITVAKSQTTAITTSSASTEKPFILTQRNEYQETDGLMSMGERTGSLEPLLPEDEDEILNVVVSDANLTLNALAEMEEDLEQREAEAAKFDEAVAAHKKKETKDKEADVTTKKDLPIPIVVVEEAKLERKKSTEVDKDAREELPETDKITEESEITKGKGKKGHAPPRPDEMVPEQTGITSPGASLQPSQPPPQALSPLSARHISKIGSAPPRRSQPKTGWL